MGAIMDSIASILFPPKGSMTNSARRVQLEFFRLERLTTTGTEFPELVIQRLAAHCAAGEEDIAKNGVAADQK